MRLPESEPVSADTQWARVMETMIRGALPFKLLPCEIRPDLLLGAQQEARDVARLQERGITHILNMAAGAGTLAVQTGPAFYGDVFVYHAISAEDDSSYDLIQQHFDECFQYWQDCRRAGGKLFIHCMAGINRSGAMAIALLMATENMDLLTATRHCLQQRGPVCWNQVSRGRAFPRVHTHHCATDAHTCPAVAGRVQGFQLQLVRFARERNLLVGDPSHQLMPDDDELDNDDDWSPV